jgi:hypothetical protein
MNDDESFLIPELATWNNGAGITLNAWISGVGRFDHALGYAAIFWPSFIQYESCILRSVPDRSAYQQWMKSMDGETAKVEAMMNHLHLIDLFACSDYQPNKALLLRLGQIMTEMWSCKLARDFPDKRFGIQLISDSEDVTDWELTFFQCPKSSSLSEG